MSAVTGLGIAVAVVLAFVFGFGAGVIERTGPGPRAVFQNRRRKLRRASDRNAHEAYRLQRQMQTRVDAVYHSKEFIDGDGRPASLADLETRGLYSKDSLPVDDLSSETLPSALPDYDAIMAGRPK